MWQLIKRKIIQPKVAVGLHIKHGGDDQYRLCVLNFTKGLVQIEKCIEGITDLVEIQKHLDKKTPIALTIQGKGILTKKN